jgi:NAD(P)-dependent dehydrogenase (short-subunit alcohol dehydrogenase family)
MDLHNATAIVTGGASGLGEATARKLAERGARVYVLDLPAAIEAAEEHEGIFYVGTDVTNGDEVERAVEQAAGGSQPLRVVVNCAGIGPSARILSKHGRHDLALFAKIVQVNLLGTFNVTAVAAEHIAKTTPLADGQRGVVVNTASVAAFDGQIGQAAYSASKGGVVGLTLPAARDLAQHGIRVNTIAPGILETPMLATVSEEYRAGLAASIPFPQRLGRPEEYGDLAAFIIEHDYLNGETIRLDGALRMAPR